MRYYTSLFLMLTTTFALGVVTGDNYAPISGATTRALTRKCAALEEKVSDLGEHVTRLEVEADLVRARVRAVLPNADL